MDIAFMTEFQLSEIIPAVQAWFVSFVVFSIGIYIFFKIRK